MQLPAFTEREVSLMLITDRHELKKYTSGHRLWQGIPSIEITKKGRIFSTFYSGGVTEQIGNFVVLLMSDDGEHFSEPIAVAYQDGHRCFDPCVWIDPLGRLWLEWSRMPDDGVYAAICEDPDAEEPVFGEEFFVGNNIMMNKPTILTTGEWLFPIAVWNHGVRVLPAEYDPAPEVERGSFAYKTVDQGRTFEKLGGADVPCRSFDEHMILELNDGRLAVYVRTEYGIGVSYSYDRGRTWTPGQDSGISAPCSRFHIRRLPSGRVLMINHVDFTGRNNLTALLSEDDGKTWKYKLLLDGRDYVSYPDAALSEDGYLYITYDRERGCSLGSIEKVYTWAREILYAKITEEDIMAGKIVSPGSKLRCIISKLGKYEDEADNPYKEADRFDDRELAELLLSENTENVIDKVFEYYPVKCVDMHKLERNRLDELAESLESSSENKKEVLAEIIAYIRSITTSKEETQPMIRRIKEILLENLSSDLSIKEIADRVGVSVYYMMHLFKKSTGITLTDYKNELKIVQAKNLLVNSDMPVTEIAQVCGFTDSSYFAKIFRRFEKIAPTEYRKMLKKN